MLPGSAQSLCRLNAFRRHLARLAFAVMAALLAGCAPTEPTENVAAKLQWHTATINALYAVTIEPLGTDIPIGEYHPWTIQINDTNGVPVSSAAIGIDGGMPGHGHGLPSQPEITQHIGNGRFLIEGMRFNMAGEWMLEFQIQSSAGADSARFDIELNF